MLPWRTDNGSPRSEDPERDLEEYLLLLLSDSNLPTGGFVASSGLESFYAHGFLHNVKPASSLTQYGSQAAQPKARPTAPSQVLLSASSLSFARSTLHSYARSSFPFLIRAHQVVVDYTERRARALLQRRQNDDDQGPSDPSYEREVDQAELDELMRSISWLDKAYHTLLLNHVARRASKAQGIALLTLYSKAFAQPINLDKQFFDGSRLGDSNAEDVQERQQEASIRIQVSADLIDRLKRDVRKSAAQASTQALSQHGHFPICWAVFSACMGLSATKSMQLHLFLQARSIFSSSIRLNTLGPYLAHQLMRFQLRDIIDQIVQELEDHGCLDIPKAADHLESMADVEQVKPAPAVKPLRSSRNQVIPVRDESQGWAWDWPEDDMDEYLSVGEKKPSSSSGFWTSSSAPATTFPLGEIVQARHDQLHSRLFNS